MKGYDRRGFPVMLSQALSTVAIVILQCFEQTLRYGTAAVQKYLTEFGN